MSEPVKRAVPVDELVGILTGLCDAAERLGYEGVNHLYWGVVNIATILDDDWSKELLRNFYQGMIEKRNPLRTLNEDTHE